MRWDRLIGTIIHPASTQLDLFLDSRAVVLANEVVAALLSRNTPNALECLRELERANPDHPSLPALAALTRALARWQVREGDVLAIADAVARLQSEVEPAVGSALGAEARPFLNRFYRELAAAATGLAYDREHPTTHRAWLCLHADEFAESEQAALSIPNWKEIPEVLHWLTVARHRLHGLEAARTSLFWLAWREPQRVPDVIAELGDELLDRDWRAFELACDWDDMPEHELPAWFPAWYVLEHPAVGNELADAPFPDGAAPAAVSLLLRLFALERQGNSKTLIAQRERLRNLDKRFFALYMLRRAVLYS